MLNHNFNQLFVVKLLIKDDNDGLCSGQWGRGIMSTLRRTSSIVPEMSVSGIPEPANKQHFWNTLVLVCTRNAQFWYTRNKRFRTKWGILGVALKRGNPHAVMRCVHAFYIAKPHAETRVRTLS